MVKQCTHDAEEKNRISFLRDMFIRKVVEYLFSRVSYVVCRCVFSNWFVHADISDFLVQDDCAK